MEGSGNSEMCAIPAREHCVKEKPIFWHCPSGLPQRQISWPSMHGQTDTTRFDKYRSVRYVVCAKLSTVVCLKNQTLDYFKYKTTPKK